MPRGPARNNDNANAGGQAGECSLRLDHWQNEIINMNSKQGYNHWKHPTEKLEKELYDCDPEGFTTS